MKRGGERSNVTLFIVDTCVSFSCGYSSLGPCMGIRKMLLFGKFHFCLHTSVLSQVCFKLVYHIFLLQTRDSHGASLWNKQLCLCNGIHDGGPLRCPCCFIMLVFLLSTLVRVFGWVAMVVVANMPTTIPAQRGRRNNQCLLYLFNVEEGE